MKLIVGLGNPGVKYDNTRHNVGFNVIDECARSMKIELNQAKFKGIFGFRMIGNEKVFLLKPQTYMNLSGESVRPLMDYYKLTLDDLVVIYDDLDLAPGKIRLRKKGGHGGHNGIKSLIAHLGTKDFNRIRVGIGRPEVGSDIVPYVLGTFPPADKQPLDDAINLSVQACEKWLTNDFSKVMNQFN